MSNSLWIHTAYPRDRFPTLDDDIRCDVCIVGGGLSGLANAYFLAKEGKDVVLLEKDMILNGATGNSTGKLTAQHDFVYAKLLKQFGKDNSKIYYDVNEEAIQFGKSIAKDDELRMADSILYSQSKNGTELLHHEMRAYKELGIPGEFGHNSELPIQIDATLTLKNESQIHPIRFGQHLARLAIEAGARIYEQSDVQLMDLNKRLLKLKSDHEVQFNELVLCTHYPIEALRGLQIMKLSVDRSYIVAAEADMALRGQYIAVDSPKRSIRTAQIDGKTYFLLSGESHQAGLESATQIHYDRLYTEVKETFNLSKSVYGWSAQDPQTPDLIPYAGTISSSMSHVYLSTGYRKWGLSNSMVSARIISDLIVGRTNKASALYSPDRTGFGSFVLQALKNTGLVVKEFTAGHLTRMDAPICTHMGCRTRWNDGDETWDCPCHGSRFRKDGSVLEGPATKPLDL
ncbi:FAD-dependent oxidoreductase [Sporosarcina limicola]|uniref:Glycine/D-amino acid oxidase-like deaminating enzyme n=1 Tax=Sporosarcina limicola TaxID=34101 RepID=A0A927MLI6_9BACL|nr:FAD-dependent oxidoreductase [Sporosarcina limicola]MBE1555132.1 glycine/D-amino acid oxidase-like deaminating enzyme [Sporosarcina limicola]